MSRVPLLLLLSLALGAPAAYADTLVVDVTPGPGVDHTSVAAAVAASAPGDTILVREGDYPEDLDLGPHDLRLIAEDGDEVNVGALVVRGVAAPSSLLVQGLRIFSGPASQAVLVEDCDGVVQFDQVTTVAGQGAAVPAHGLVVRRCSSVVVSRSTIFAASADVVGAGSGAVVGAGLLGLFDSTVIGGFGVGGDVVFDGGAGLVVEPGGRIDMSGGTLRGGDGGHGFGPPPSDGGQGGHGSVVQDSTGLARLIGVDLQPGTGGDAPAPFLSGNDGEDGIAPAGTIAYSDQAQRTLDADGPYRPGQTMTLRYDGKTQDLAVLFLSFSATPRLLPSPAGSLKLGGLFVPDLGTDLSFTFVLPGGNFTVMEPAPVLPVTATIHAQALTLATYPFPGIVNSTPIPVTILAPGL